MVITKASKAQSVKPSHWLFIIPQFYQDCDGWIKANPWRRRIESDPRFPQLGHVEWLEGPIKLDYTTFLGEVKSKLESLISEEHPISPSEWKVVLVPTHGDKNAGITMHPDPEDKTMHWGRAYQWFSPFHSLGVRRLHVHTCYVGAKFLDLPVCKTPIPGEVMTVTAWSDWLWTPDQEYLVERWDSLLWCR